MMDKMPNPMDLALIPPTPMTVPSLVVACARSVLSSARTTHTWAAVSSRNGYQITRSLCSGYRCGLYGVSSGYSSVEFVW